MKFLLVLALLGLSVSAVVAEDVQGTLIFERGKIIFRSDGIEEIFDPAAAPGLKVVSFTKKSQVHGDRETDVSELEVEFSPGKRVMLIACKPLAVIRTGRGSETTWKVGPN